MLKSDFKFTFHNVSINTLNEGYWTIEQAHLHSTMFLLILIYHFRLMHSMREIYIPQCFY